MRRLGTPENTIAVMTFYTKRTPQVLIEKLCCWSALLWGLRASEKDCEYLVIFRCPWRCGCGYQTSELATRN